MIGKLIACLKGEVGLHSADLAVAGAPYKTHASDVSVVLKIPFKGARTYGKDHRF